MSSGRLLLSLCNYHESRFHARKHLLLTSIIRLLFLLYHNMRFLTKATGVESKQCLVLKPIPFGFFLVFQCRCDRDFVLLQTFQPITIQHGSHNTKLCFDWLKYLQRSLENGASDLKSVNLQYNTLIAGPMGQTTRRPSV